MTDNTPNTMNADFQALVKDAQDLFHNAATATGETADDYRHRGMNLLDIAMKKAQTLQENAVVLGKEVATSTNDYVKENPWRVIAAAAGIGLVTGLLIGRK
ncbi:DUF883 family protein [Leeia oryzae]|uniref:DUF883 family protein n=1 Tax=Leeia oryzae TaxID=356662 RepID=UPI00036C35CE|nr:DUF883 family protein [Leeia oryzae]